MKQLFLIFVFICLGSNAQTIVPMYQAERNHSEVYYKDTFNDLDKLIGTWKFTTGSTSLTITLQKKVQQTVYNQDGTYYERDFIVGGYKYIENGVEKINTLPQLAISSDVYEYYIVGSVIAGPDSVYCLDCGPNDRIIILGFVDPARFIEGYEPQMLFKRADSGGIQKLELDFRTISGGYEEEGVTPEYTEYSVPFGKYILIKQ